MTITLTAAEKTLRMDNWKIPQKYRHRIDDLSQDSDGWWIWLSEGWEASDGTMTIREDSKREALAELRDARPVNAAIDKLAAQVWMRLGETAENAEDFGGRSLLNRAIEHGWFVDAQSAEGWFEQSEVGTVMNTGVSSFERIV